MKGPRVIAQNTRRWGARLTAAAGVAALGAMALSAPAFAAPEYGNIDVNRSDATLTIHKHEWQAGQSSPKTGDPAGPGDTLPGPISGVTFTAYPITSLPLNVPANWDTLAGANFGSSAVCPVLNSDPAAPAASIPGQTLGAGVPFDPTDSDGISTKTLPVAAYLVCETASTASPEVTHAAAPFVVTVPFPDNQAGAPSNSNGWLYNVHAYPKNQRAVTVTKTVDSQEGKLGLGETVSFPTTTGIPRIADENQFTRYTVIDPMDTRLTDIKVVSVKVDGVDVDSSYYTVEGKDIASNLLYVEFTPAGLTWLKGQGGKSVVTVFEGTVSSLDADASLGLGAGVIFNKAYLMTDNEKLPEPPVTPPTPPVTPPTDPEEPVPPTNPPFPPTTPPTTPSNEVNQNWGDIQLWKRDNQGNTNVGLNGAVFEVYEAATPYPVDGVCATDIKAPVAPATETDPITVNNATTFTSVNGVVSIAGLFVSNSVLPGQVGETSRCYVVKEVTAPAGFVLPKDGAELTAIKVAIGKTAINTTTGAGADATITNVKQDVPDLPLTGGQAQLLMMIGGAALVLVAAGAAIVARRRSSEASAE